MRASPCFGPHPSPALPSPNEHADKAAFKTISLTADNCAALAKTCYAAAKEAYVTEEQVPSNIQAETFGAPVVFDILNIKQGFSIKNSGLSCINIFSL
jgi:hypothetical protein